MPARLTAGLLADLLRLVPPPAGSVAVAPGDARLELTRLLVRAGSEVADLEDAAAGSADTVIVPELRRGAGEPVLAQADNVLRPHGRLLACAPGHLHGGLRARELVTALGHFGVADVLTVAPGVGALLRGGNAIVDLDIDREPGLLDAGPLVAVLGRRARDLKERSQTFFATLPRKVVAAAVCCRDGRGRLLCVEDLFKGHWTIPGGVVDADEAPDAAAAREALEEAGVAVEVGALIGVFTAAWPDRITFLFAATPVPAPTDAGARTGLRTRHPHEIGAVEWVPWDDALTRVAAYVGEQLRLSASEPGRVWRS